MTTPTLDTMYAELAELRKIRDAATDAIVAFDNDDVRELMDRLRVLSDALGPKVEEPFVVGAEEVEATIPKAYAEIIRLYPHARHWWDFSKNPPEPIPAVRACSCDRHFPCDKEGRK